ncbi:SPOR domain-containing protein [Sphingomonas quercus]|uniref:SPOR domain-containing protein n=1 Tax=Sphingomonas quercus TaxID=2842451 RepID=A0ABS6BM45_9SPHN|nr:SPOR domain-containing protein [Sphingomonas quercus]MBU3078456.1 SPOR domain-containing protein [Sphingomonas quercus]
MAPPGPGRGYPDEDRLPWLQEAPDETRTYNLPLVPIIAAVIAIAIVLGLGTVAWRWWRDQPAADGSAGLIKAPPGPYKVKPDDPGGMEVEGEGFASYQASEGADPRAVLDLSALPEAPMAKPHAQPEHAETEPPAAPASSPPAPAQVTSNGSIQLGAFSTEGKANAAWKALSARFRFLAEFTPVVLPARAGAGTVYRLRANVGPQASDFCGRLKVAGETCMVVGG